MAQDRKQLIQAILTDDNLADFERVKAYHGIRANADVVRLLIRQEARRIRTNGNPGSVHAILSGYLAGQVTAEEAMQALTMHRELMPVP